jgi:translation initiation factor 1
MSEICEVCGLPKEICVCEDIAREQQKITIAVDKRRYGIDPHELDIDSLITQLKSKCACGGTIKEGKIELQGDHRTRVKETLEKMGFTVEVI